MAVYQLAKDSTIVLQNLLDIPCCYLGCFTEYNTSSVNIWYGIVGPSLATLILIPVFGIVAL